MITTNSAIVRKTKVTAVSRDGITLGWISEGGNRIWVSWPGAGLFGDRPFDSFEDAMNFLLAR